MEYSWFWRDELWFPIKKGVLMCGWKDLENTPGSNAYYPQTSDLHWSLIIGILLIVFRYVSDKFIVERAGYKLGVPRRKHRTVDDIPVLEKMYLQKTKINSQLIQKMAKQTDMKERQIQIWFRRRKRLDAPPAIMKFKDCSWHFTFYGIAFVYGVKVLWNKPWLWKTTNCWYGWPTQSVDPDIYWYYIIELAFYWSLVFTLFTDHKRKLAKMCNYCKFPLGKELAFVIFILVWVVSRLWFYPFIIAKIIINKFKAGDVQDVRSDTEDDFESDDDTNTSNTNDDNHVNGNGATKIK
ncbi:Ceramide synthase 5 [Mactra antiquata]